MEESMDKATTFTQASARPQSSTVEQAEGPGQEAKTLQKGHPLQQTQQAGIWD